MFELTILFGAILTLVGLFLLAKLPSHKVVDNDEHYDPRVTDDHYALYVSIEEVDKDKVAEILKTEGAEVRS